MDYTLYLQNEGSVVQTLIEKVVQSQGQDQSALQQLLQLAEEGNEEAVAFLQSLLELATPEMKCGGKIKKKQLGQKIQKTKKAECGCVLKKVGGRLTEVDSCTGLPVHKNGGLVRKYQQAGKMSFNYNQDRWKKGYYYSTKGNNRWYGVNPVDGKVYTTGTPTIELPSSTYTTTITMPYSALPDYVRNNLGLISLEDGFYIRDLGNGLYGGWNDRGQYRRYGKLSNGNYRWDSGNSNYVFKNDIWVDPNQPVNPLSANMELKFANHGNDKVLMHNDDVYYNNGRAKINGKMTNYDINSINWTPEQKLQLWNAGFNLLAGKPVEVQKTPTETWRSNFGAGKSGKFGGLTYDEALARLKEMLNADWFNANLGRFGADGKWGDTSKKEWDRYQAALASRQASPAQLTPIQSTPLTNQLLLNILDKDAISSLSDADFLRWMKLNQHNASRNAALVYNGHKYDNELAYNQAMNDKIMQEMPSLLAISDIMNVRGRRKRNSLYNEYVSEVDSLANKYKQYQGPSALTEQLLAATTFKNVGI